MTQEVQPLTWQKRTNLEEHQQFFSKINEIIANLAPTVNEAEAAIAQATQAIASANAAINTANAASANADAASQQAQTAANTVAGYDTRLIAVEDESAGNNANIIDLQDRMGTAEGNITALQNVQTDYVKKAGAAQTVTSQIMVPTTATGLRDTQIANGVRIQNDLDAYAPMVRTSGNQIISGVKTFSGNDTSKKANYDPSVRPSQYVGVYPKLLTDSNNNDVLRIRIDRETTATAVGFQIYLSNNQGARKSSILSVRVNHSTGGCSLAFIDTTNTTHNLATWTDNDLKDA